MNTITRPNIYSNLPPLIRELDYFVIGTTVGATAGIFLLFVVVVIMYRSFCVEPTKSATGGAEVQDRLIRSRGRQLNDWPTRNHGHFSGHVEEMGPLPMNMEDHTDSEEARVEPNAWKSTFDKILCIPKEGSNAAVHALIYMPVDLWLFDPIENPELDSDVYRMRRAQNRRRALENII